MSVGGGGGVVKCLGLSLDEHEPVALPMFLFYCFISPWLWFSLIFHHHRHALRCLNPGWFHFSCYKGADHSYKGVSTISTLHLCPTVITVSCSRLTDSMEISQTDSFSIYFWGKWAQSVTEAIDAVQQRTRHSGKIIHDSPLFLFF